MARVDVTETKFMFTAAEKGKILHIAEGDSIWGKEELITLCGRTQKLETTTWYDYYSVEDYPFNRELCPRCVAVQAPEPILAQMRIDRTEYRARVDAEQKERDELNAKRLMVQAEVSARLESGLKELFGELGLVLLGRRSDKELSAVGETPYGKIFYGVRIEEFSRPFWYGHDWSEQGKEVERIVKLSQTGGDK